MGWLRSGGLAAGAVAAVLVCVQACSRGWDDFDPRLGEGGSATAGEGGHLSGGGGPGGGGTAGGGADGGGGAGGGGAVLCGGVGLLTDDFEDGSLGHDDWYIVDENGGLVTEQSGALVLRLPASGSGSAYHNSWEAFDLRGRSLTFELSAVPFSAQMEGWISVGYDSDNYVEFNFIDGNLNCAIEIDTNWVIVATQSYESTAHRFLRIREDAGTVYWEASPDGATFSELHSRSVTGVFDPQYATLAIGADGNGAGSTVEMRLEGIVGSGAPGEDFCPMSALTDDFDDGVRSAAWQEDFMMSGCTIAETGGQVVVSVAAGTPDEHVCAWVSSSSYDLVEDAASIEIVDGASSGSATEMWFGVGLTTDDALLFDIHQGTVHIAYVQNENWHALVDLPYSATNHRWLRIRQASISTYWETSADGSNWVEQASAVVPFDVSRVRIGLGGGADGSLSSPQQLSFDNINLTP